MVRRGIGFLVVGANRALPLREVALGGLPAAVPLTLAALFWICGSVVADVACVCMYGEGGVSVAVECCVSGLGWWGGCRRVGAVSGLFVVGLLCVGGVGWAGGLDVVVVNSGRGGCSSGTLAWGFSEQIWVVFSFTVAVSASNPPLCAVEQVVSLLFEVAVGGGTGMSWACSRWVVVRQ